MTTPATPPTPTPNPTPAPTTSPSPAPTSTETPAQAVAAVGADVASDVAAVEAAVTGTGATAVKADATALYSAARAEYDSLEPAAQGRLHQALNDIETAFNLSLGGIHSLFGTK